MIKKLLLWIPSFILIFVVLLAVLLSVFEFKPEPIQDVPFSSGEKILQKNESYSILSWNIGYAGLGKYSDYFFSGGKDVRPSKKLNESYFNGIKNTLAQNPVDFLLIQEIDRDSHRSRYVDQFDVLKEFLNKKGAFATAYKCIFVPFPLPPIGKVDSGIATFFDFKTTSAARYSLPVLFKWPVRTANLKRCFLVTRIPVYENGLPTEKELVLVNLHLEAFDAGQAKIAQTKKLIDFLNSEYQKGNYVIAGGDFNQTFPDAKEFPFNNTDPWVAPILEKDSLQKDWEYCFDDSNPSCRSTCSPYVGTLAENHDFQYYLIDGFIKSPNVEISVVETLNEDFVYSDHNPIRLEFSLK